MAADRPPDHPPDDPHTRVAEDRGVLTITLTRARKLNAISDEINRTLWDGVRSLRARDDLRVMVITAEGRYFSAGVDLHSSLGGGGDVDPADPAAGYKFRRQLRDYHLLLDEMEAVEKPVVLGAQGPCFGAGLELAVSADFRLCSEATTFRLPEVALGVLSSSGGASRLTRLVGPAWAKWIAMADETVDATAAHHMGLVHRVLPVEGFHDELHAFALKLAGLPMEAMGVTKQVIALAERAGHDAARSIDRIANTHLIFRPEFRDQLDAFRTRGRG